MTKNVDVETENEKTQELMTLTQVKAVFKLTDRLVRMIGEPDCLKPNPHYACAAPMKLFKRSRVEQWIRDNQDLVAESAKRQESANKGVETKWSKAKKAVADLLSNFHMDVIDRETVEREATDYYWGTYPYWNVLTDRALCSFIRHNYTNYEQILSTIKGRVGAQDLYEASKIYLCAQIIRAYELVEITPEYAAFGKIRPWPWNKSYPDGQAEMKAARMLGISLGDGVSDSNRANVA